ncbi:class I SAM-dependent methyltransferase [Reyranella sp.]|uniref:class I SAM-dependent methyltransferase n=1 Tax=Reyranella sp. TaxID=1929291 RepID=UPI003D0B68A6
MINEAKLGELMGRMLGDLGGAMSIALVRVGDSLGLYKALHDKGPLTPAGLAAATGTAERYVREWLAAQAASGYVAYDKATGTFSLPAEQAMVFADEDSPVFLMGAFDAAAAMLQSQSRVQEAFKTGGGVQWGDQAACCFCATARFFRPGYRANLVAQWLPALDGVVDKLRAGATVADVGCGHGLSTIIMAEAFPNSQFTGFDFHEGSIDAAREHARQHGAGNVRFEVAKAKEFTGRGYDLVTFFDCLHDMGDPAGAAAHVRRALKPDGSWMIVEPLARDRLEDNLNPVGRLYYSASTMICVPTSLSQEVGAALGAQAGEAKLREMISRGGFTQVRRATETPFNMILEARP